MWRKAVAPLETEAQATRSIRDENFLSNQHETTYSKFLKFAEDVLFQTVKCQPNGETYESILLYVCDKESGR